VKSLYSKNVKNILWISHVLPVGYVAFLHKKLFKTKYRVYVHGLDLIRPRESVWKTFWVTKILFSADEIVANSFATLELLEYYGKELKNKAVVVYPKIKKIETEKYKIKGHVLREKYNLKDKKILFTISRLVRRKGIDLVISALEEIQKYVTDLVYVVAGVGPEEERLKSMAKGKNVIFIGFVSEEEKYSWMSECDCFILVPRDENDDFEGYGIVYKEVEQFNKKVIGSASGGVSEAVGNVGILVEPGNIKEITKAVIYYAKS